MNRTEKGEMAFLPSNITLLKFKPAGIPRNAAVDTPVSKWIKTKRPTHVLVIEPSPRGFKHGVYTEILYQGESWMARQMDLYPVRD